VSSYVRQLEEAEKARRASHQRFLKRRKSGLCMEVRLALRYRDKTPQRYKAAFGCTYAELALHIERQFTDGMTWDNMGKWHIDHIVPLSYLIENRMESRANHYTNLRPLWAKDNLSKGAKLCKYK